MISRKKQIKHTLEYGLIIFMLTLFQLLGVRFARILGRNLGHLAFHLLIKERQKMITHLAIAFPEKFLHDLLLLAKSTFAHFGTAIADIANTDTIIKHLDSYVYMSESSKKVLDTIQSLDRGTIFISGHLGNWEMLALYMSQKGYTVSTVVKELYDSRINQLMTNYRQKAGIRLIVRKKDGQMTQILKALGQAGIVGFIIDQDLRKNGVFVPFFGKPAYTPKGAAQIALKKNLPVVHGFCVLESDGKYQLHVEPPVTLIKTDNLENDIIQNTANFTQIIETYIKRYPNQWVWMHKRWHTKPETSHLDSPVMDGNPQ